MISSWRWVVADLLLAVAGGWAYFNTAPGTNRIVIGAAAVWFAADLVLNQVLGDPGEMA